ncbi:heme-binding domain-containing protein [Occallatibacter savannae]|uniref:heme-binding domain-containing protein n=1 Tax=Occallatibacter savannae TaxID=1002691 RepID=UPI000D69AADC|nr:heme-binding domain-containing protein [Occallatibacter savannae]
MVGKITTGFAGAVFAAALGLSFVHPWGDVRNVDAGGELLGGSEISPGVRQVLEQKCGDCHSNRTHWPVYSRLAPGSWVMEHDVSDGRQALNFSRWQKMRADQQIEALSRIAAEIRSEEMPPTAYTMMHPTRHISDAEKQAVAAWARAERRRVRAAMEGQKEKSGQ